MISIFRGQSADLKEFVNIVLKNTCLEIDLGNCLFLLSVHIKCELLFRPYIVLFYFSSERCKL